MTYYHGSPISDLTELTPTISEHDKPYVYFSLNPLVALLYAVKPVEKPYSYYPYGFDKDGKIIYSEYFENSFKILYEGKTGYLYECNDIQNPERLTTIKDVYLSCTAEKISRATVIPDLYAYFKEQEKLGLFSVKPYNEISEKEMAFILNDLKQSVGQAGFENDSMYLFLKEYFPNVLL